VLPLKNQSPIWGTKNLSAEYLLGISDTIVARTILLQPSADCQQLNAVEQVCSSGFEERTREYSGGEIAQVLFEDFLKMLFAQIVRHY